VTSFVSRLRGRGLRAWFTELVRFGLVGGIAYAVDQGGFFLVTKGPGHLLDHKPTTASLIFGGLGILVAWLGNRYWTFAQKRNANKGGELLAFVIVNLIGIAIATSCLAIARYVLHLSGTQSDFIARGVIGIGLGTIFRYFCYRYLIFTADDDGRGNRTLVRLRRRVAKVPPEPGPSAQTEPEATAAASSGSAGT
jgi:putative flippase GtrA